MRTLSVRKVEDRTADAIAQRAKSRGLSMEAQVREILNNTAREWENEKPQETGHDMLKRIRARFDDLHQNHEGVIDEWITAMENSPLRTTRLRNPFSDTE